MNQSLPELIEGMRRALREDVQGELATDHARSQLAGVLDILAKLERMVAWSPDVLHEQLRTLERGCEAFARLAGTAVDAEPAPASALTGTPPSQGELEAAVREAEARLNRQTDWLFAHGAALEPALRERLHGQQQQTFRALLLAERRLVPRANFGAMTAGAGKAQAPT